MSEIEKMYEKVGLASHLCKYPRFCDDNNCNECPNYSSEFTAEKQLELIKWLAKTRPIHITFLIDKWVIEGMVRYGKRYDTFEDALSGYINNIWQDLTESEQEQIRSILNGN